MKTKKKQAKRLKAAKVPAISNHELAKSVTNEIYDVLRRHKCRMGLGLFRKGKFEFSAMY